MENINDSQVQVPETTEAPETTEVQETKTFVPVRGINKKSKLVGLLAFLLAVFTVSDYTALSFAIDDDMLFGLFAIVPVFLLAVLIFFIKNATSSITVAQEYVHGKSAFGKSFSLKIDKSLVVTESKFNGIKIASGLNSVTVPFIDNREDVCKALHEAGASVLVTLIPDENVIVSSVPDSGKVKLHVMFTMLSAFLADVFMTISALWYNSSANTRVWTSTTYDYEYIYGYWYKIPDYNYHYGKYYYFEEMFTSYISMAFSLICLILLIVLFVRLSNKLTVSPDFVTGTKFFGKTEKMNIDSINNIKSNAVGSSVSFSFGGKKKSYSYIGNNSFIAMKIQNAKLEKFNARKTAAEAENKSDSQETDITE